MPIGESTHDQGQLQKGESSSNGAQKTLSGMHTQTSRTETESAWGHTHRDEPSKGPQTSRIEAKWESSCRWAPRKHCEVNGNLPTRIDIKENLLELSHRLADPNNKNKDRIICLAQDTVAR